MRFSIRRERSTTFVDFWGQLTVENRLALKRAVLGELQAGVRTFVVDRARAVSVDSCGLDVLVSLSSAIREHGGELWVTNLNTELRTIFQLGKLDLIFQVAEVDGGGVAGRPTPPPGSAPGNYTHL